MPQSIGNRSTKEEQEISNEHHFSYIIIFDMKIGTKQRNNISACQEIEDILISVDHGLRLITWFEQSNQSEPLIRKIISITQHVVMLN